VTNPVDHPGFPLATDVRPDVPPKKGNAGKVVVAVVVAIIVALGVYSLSSLLLGGDDASDAKADRRHGGSRKANNRLGSGDVPVWR
jgi:hypothetical protein